VVSVLGFPIVVLSREGRMPYVKCPCGVRLRYTRTHNGWQEHWEGPQRQDCPVIAKRLAEKGRVEGADATCETISRVVQSDIHD
jgi:hypothetical protein